MRDFYNYILVTESGRCSYVGYTVDFKKRFRQHKKEIVGGAKYTRNMTTCGEIWTPLLVVKGCPSSTLALQLEYAQKAKMAKSRNGQLSTEVKKKIAESNLHHRLKMLLQALHMNKWSTRATHQVNDISLIFYWPADPPTEFISLLPTESRHSHRNLSELTV